MSVVIYVYNTHFILGYIVLSACVCCVHEMTGLYIHSIIAAVSYMFVCMEIALMEQLLHIYTYIHTYIDGFGSHCDIV